MRPFRDTHPDSPTPTTSPLLHPLHLSKLLQELKRLKNLKKKELTRKLKEIEKSTGASSSLGLKIEDLDGDFDMDEYV